MCLHPQAFKARLGRGQKPQPTGGTMIRRFGFLLLPLPVAAALPAVPAVAKYYPSPPPPGYYRGGPPPGAYYEDRLPPSFWNDGDEDDRPVRRQRRVPQMSQQ